LKKRNFCIIIFIEGSPYLPSIIYKGDDNINKEIWKDIKHYEGFYQVSNLGNVRSVPRNGTVKYYKILKPNNVKGYYQVTLQKKGKKKIYKVHRLVAKTFIKNTYNKREVNHIDGNKLNNVVTNLEWVTSSENQIHAFKMGLQKPHPKYGKENIYSKKIKQYDLNGNFIKTWDCIREASVFLKVSSSGIISCCKKRQHTSAGFFWEYVEGYEKLKKGRW
jgi:hypothetical protein